jgi:hypothetical protein
MAGKKIEQKEKIEWEAVQIRLKPDEAKALDDARRKADDLPSRSDLALRFVLAGLKIKRA